MKLYMLRGCPFAHRAAIALGEKKLPFDAVLFDAEKRPPELEALGPHAKSPTLFDGDLKIWDSAVITEYLEDRYPEWPLLPSDAAARAEVRMLNQRVAAELAPKLGAIVQEVVRKPAPERDQAKIDAARRAFLDALAPWDAHLDGRTFLVGDAFTLADVTLYTLFPAVKHLAEIEIPTERGHLRAWLDRVAARPSTKPVTPRS
jgi:glutathione S-transferase